MPSFLSRLTAGRANAPAEMKAQTLFSLTELTGPSWTGRGYASLAREGFARNPVVYRCIRMIAEAATRVPLRVVENGETQTEHPVAALLTRPNAQESGRELFERLYAYLQTAGNAYLQAALGEGWALSEMPLDASPESYRIAIGDGTNVLRTLTATTGAVTYSAADQTTDFGALPASFTYDIAQVSAVYGAGRKERGTFNG